MTGPEIEAVMMDMWRMTVQFKHMKSPDETCVARGFVSSKRTCFISLLRAGETVCHLWCYLIGFLLEISGRTPCLGYCCLQAGPNIPSGGVGKLSKIANRKDDFHCPSLPPSKATLHLHKITHLVAAKTNVPSFPSIPRSFWS